MENTGGIGPAKGGEISGAGAPGASESEKMANVMSTPVRTMGQMEKLLADKLGPNKAKELYDAFIKSFAMTMLTQMQKYSKDAQAAAKKMREGNAP